MAGTIRVGIGGWTFEPRRGVFYPKGLRQADELSYAAERLTAIAAHHPGLTVHIVASAEDGRLTAARLAQLTPFPLRDAELFYCGPAGLRDAIVSDLQATGQRPRRIHHEAFELR